MNELPRSSKYRSSPDEQVSAQEREQLTRRLNEAFTAGKLTQDDYSARLDELYAAQRLGDLVPVVESLPAVQSYSEPAMVQQTGAQQPGELSVASSNGSRMTVALVGGIAAIVIILVILLLVLL
ncbi:DUF1707 SHOCT-like domain-containing protein [Microlunatus soli]|uniref:DUF1707 SHOCT-like domain-containing protein n=1 Tax=Microlunatus soli TaxID=630515 RepID=UPI0012F7A3C4|nr:DUF1707 domain-containing protein [Microlunatus soli]